MLFKNEYYCILDNNLIIKTISTKLLKILEYENIDEVRNRHLSVVLPKYFLTLKSENKNNNYKFLALLVSKRNENIPVSIKSKQKADKIILNIKINKSNILKNFADDQTFFNQINQAASFGIIIFNEQGYVVYVNDAICNMYNYLHHEIIGLHGTKFIHQKNHKEFYRLINEVKPDEAFYIKSIEIKKDGSTFNSLVEGKVVNTKFGKFLTAIVFDITKDIERDEELENKKNILKKIFDLSPVGYFIYDDNFKVTETNKAFLEQLSIKEEELIGLDLNTLKDKGPLKMLLSPFEQKSGFFEGFYTSTLSDQTRYLKAFTFPFNNKSRRFAFGVSLDLTKEMQIEKELLQKTQFYESLFNTALTGIGITDTNEIFTLVNPAFANMLGYTVDEMLNTHLSLYTTPRQMVLFSKQTEQRKKGNSGIYEASLLDKNGNIIHVLIHASPLKNEKGIIIGTLGIIIDLTYQDFLLKQISALTEKNNDIVKEKQKQLQSIFNHLKMTVPILLEISTAIADDKLSKEQKKVLADSIDKQLYNLSNTYQLVELLTQCEQDNYKLRIKKISLNEFNKKLRDFFVQKTSQPQTLCSIFFEEFNSNEKIEIAEDTIFKTFNFILNNIILRHNVDTVLIKQQILSNKIVFEITAKLNDNLIPLKYFNQSALCYQLAYKLILKQKGSLNYSENNVVIEIPLIKVLPTVEHFSIKVDLNNNYTTKIWANYMLIVITENLNFGSMVKHLLLPTEMNVIVAPCGGAFIPFIMQNTMADIILLDDNIVGKDGIDYLTLCKRFLPNVPIIGITNSNQTSENSYDDLIYQAKNFEEDFFVKLSKYLEYGKSN